MIKKWEAPVSLKRSEWTTDLQRIVFLWAPTELKLSVHPIKNIWFNDQLAPDWEDEERIVRIILVILYILVYMYLFSLCFMKQWVEVCLAWIDISCESSVRPVPFCDRN